MMIRTALAVTTLLPLMVVGAGSGYAAQSKLAEPATAATTNFDPCSLLTYDEIKSAVGWKPDSSRAKAYGSTGNCTWYGPNAMTQNVALLIGQGMPDMSSSKTMAQWRAKQYTDYKVKDAIVEPVEGLGVPAIRNEWGTVGIEMAVDKQLVSVSGLTLKFDQVKKLAAFVLARMKK